MDMSFASGFSIPTVLVGQITAKVLSLEIAGLLAVKKLSKSTTVEMRAAPGTSVMYEIDWQKYQRKALLNLLVRKMSFFTSFRSLVD